MSDGGGLSIDEQAALVLDVEAAKSRLNDPGHPLANDPGERDRRLVQLDALLIRAGIGEEDRRPLTAPELAEAQFAEQWATAASGPSEHARTLIQQHLELVAGLHPAAREAEERDLRRSLGDARYAALIKDAEAGVQQFPELKGKLPDEARGSMAVLRVLAEHAKYNQAYQRARATAKL